jgi:hypothetical protein
MMVGYDGAARRYTVAAISDTGDEHLGEAAPQVADEALYLSLVLAPQGWLSPGGTP